MERKLSSYLVRDKLYRIEGKVGSCKCNGKRCEVCKNVLETDIFTCSNNQTTELPGHIDFLQDTYVTLIDKIDPRTSTEDYWIHALKTKTPVGRDGEGDY